MRFQIYAIIFQIFRAQFVVQIDSQFDDRRVTIRVRRDGNQFRRSIQDKCLLCPAHDRKLVENNKRSIRRNEFCTQTNKSKVRKPRQCLETDSSYKKKLEYQSMVGRMSQNFIAMKKLLRLEKYVDKHDNNFKLFKNF